MSFRERLGNWLLKTIEVDDQLLATSYDDVGWSTESYDALSREGFEQCSTVYRCVNLVSKGMANNVPFGIKDDEDEIISDHPLIDKLKRPNPLMGRSWYLRYWAMCLLLGGRAFQWANISSDGEILELWPLPPNSVEIKHGNRMGEIIGFTLRYSSGEMNIDQNLPLEQVLYSWFPNPRDFMQPMAPMKAAAREIDISNEGLSWNLSLLANQAKPSFWVGIKGDSEAIITQPQAEAVERAMRKKWGGKKNVGKPVVFRHPGLELHEFGWNPSDMEWLKGLDKADVHIANVFDVPPELVGTQKTYENYAEANKALYTDAIIPIASFYCDEMNNWAAGGIREGETLCPITAEIDALQEDQSEKSKRLGEDVDRGIITRNEARSAKGLMKSEDPMADVLTVAKEVVPLAEVMINSGLESREEDGHEH